MRTTRGADGVVGLTGFVHVISLLGSLSRPVGDTAMSRALYVAPIEVGMVMTFCSKLVIV